MGDAERIVTYLTRLARRLTLHELDTFFADNTKLKQAGMSYWKRLSTKPKGTELSENDVADLTSRLRNEYLRTKDISQALPVVLAYCRRTYCAPFDVIEKYA